MLGSPSRTLKRMRSHAVRASVVSEACFFSLPEELLQIILSFSTLPSAVAMKSACKQFSHSVASCWRDDVWLAAHLSARQLLAYTSYRPAPAETILAAALQRRLEACPAEAWEVEPSAFGGEGRATLLHHALESGCESLLMFEQLLDAYPRAVLRRCSDFSALPLEHAAEYGASIDVIAALVRAHERMGCELDGDAILEEPVRWFASRLTCVHLAVINGSSEATVRMLLGAYPELSRAWACENPHDDNACDMLALHFAAIYADDPGVITALYEVHPSAAATRDSWHGMLPLHLAALSGAPADVVSAVHRCFPEAMGVMDSYGRTPLDCALARASDARQAAPGYSYKLYAGLNEHTPDRLASRGSSAHHRQTVSRFEELELHLHAQRQCPSPSRDHTLTAARDHDREIRAA